MTHSKFVLKKVVHKTTYKNMKGQTLSHMDRILLGNVIMKAEQRSVTFHYINYRWIKRIFLMFNPYLEDMIQLKYMDCRFHKHPIYARSEPIWLDLQWFLCSRHKKEATRRMKNFLLDSERWLGFCGCLGDGELWNPDSDLMVDGRDNKWSVWWFQIFFIFIPSWGHDPIWLICFKGVETTN